MIGILREEAIARMAVQPNPPKTSLSHEDIEMAIKTIEYGKIGKKTTLCCITTDSGFEVVGTSSCVDANNYSESTGRHYALERARQKLWELKGFELQGKLKSN